MEPERAVSPPVHTGDARQRDPNLCAKFAGWNGICVSSNRGFHTCRVTFAQFRYFACCVTLRVAASCVDRGFTVLSFSGSEAEDAGDGQSRREEGAHGVARTVNVLSAGNAVRRSGLRVRDASARHRHVRG